MRLPMAAAESSRRERRQEQSQERRQELWLCRTPRRGIVAPLPLPEPCVGRFMRVAAAPLLCALAGALGGCAGPSLPVPPPGLAYRLPSPPTLGYRMADTVRVEIQALGQSFAVEGGARSDWRMEYEPDPRGVRVTATLVDLDARMSNPLGPGQLVDESQVTGPVVFTLGPRGNPDVVSFPRIEARAAQFFTGGTIAQGFFPRLPGRSLVPGEGWVDTVSYSAAEAGAQTTVPRSAPCGAIRPRGTRRWGTPPTSSCGCRGRRSSRAPRPSRAPSSRRAWRADWRDTFSGTRAPETSIPRSTGAI